MTILEWGAIGGVVLALFIFCARIMRRGLSTLDEVRLQHADKINDEKRRLAQDIKKISADEHFHLLEAAIQDLIRLSPDPTEWTIESKAHTVHISHKTAFLEIELIMREVRLRTNSRNIHGKPHWLFRTPGCEETYSDISELMEKINLHFQNKPEIEPLPPHLARRLAGSRAQSALCKDCRRNNWKI